MLSADDRIRQRQVWGLLTALVAESRAGEGAVFRPGRTEPVCIAATPGFCDTDNFVARIWLAERRLLLAGGAVREGDRALLPVPDATRTAIIALIYLEGVGSDEPSALNAVYVDRIGQRIAAGNFRHPHPPAEAPEATPEARRAAAIRGALGRVRGNVTRAAELIGCHRDTLRLHMKTLGIQRGEFR